MGGIARGCATSTLYGSTHTSGCVVVLSPSRACAAEGYSSRRVCLSVCLSVCLCTLNLGNSSSNENKCFEYALVHGKICVKSLRRLYKVACEHEATTRSSSPCYLRTKLARGLCTSVRHSDAVRKCTAAVIANTYRFTLASAHVHVLHSLHGPCGRGIYCRYNASLIYP